MADGQYQAELRPFSWTSRTTNPLLDGVLRDMVAFWELCNMQNANTKLNMVTINSPHSAFQNDIKEDTIKLKLFKEFFFFNSDYFLTRDEA